MSDLQRLPSGIVRRLATFDNWAVVLRRELNETLNRSDQSIRDTSRSVMRSIASETYVAGKEPWSLISYKWDSLKAGHVSVLNPFTWNGDSDDDGLYELLAESILQIHRLACHNGSFRQFRRFRTECLDALDDYIQTRGFDRRPNPPDVTLGSKQAMLLQSLYRFTQWNGSLSEGTVKTDLLIRAVYPDEDPVACRAKFRKLKENLLESLTDAGCKIFVDLGKEDTKIKV